MFVLHIFHMVRELCHFLSSVETFLASGNVND